MERVIKEFREFGEYDNKEVVKVQLVSVVDEVKGNVWRVSYRSNGTEMATVCDVYGLACYLFAQHVMMRL